MKKHIKKPNGRILFVLAASAAMSAVMGLYTLFFPTEGEGEQAPMQIHAENPDADTSSDLSHADAPETLSDDPADLL